MNIISNSCIGGFLMRDYLKEKFNNPFIWSYIDNISFFNLIKNYENINWLNFELIKDKNWNFCILVDNLVKINYPHYHFDPNANKITFFDDDNQHRNVYYNKIWEYIVEKYKTRTERMLKINVKPIFILASCYDGLNDLHQYDNIIINKIDNLKTEFDIIMVSNNYKFKNKKCYTYKYSKNNIELANEIYNMNILNFK